jgi:hypothetical protein
VSLSSKGISILSAIAIFNLLGSGKLSVDTEHPITFEINIINIVILMFCFIFYLLAANVPQQPTAKRLAMLGDVAFVGSSLVFHSFLNIMIFICFKVI